MSPPATNMTPEEEAAWTKNALLGRLPFSYGWKRLMAKRHCYMCGAEVLRNVPENEKDLPRLCSSSTCRGRYMAQNRWLMNRARLD